jgi:hypothetical protein
MNPPLFEGQLSTIGLPLGTYVLKLTSEAANILRGDFNCATSSPANFAVLANQVNEDDIVFTIVPPPAPTISSARSMKTHGTAGAFGTTLGVSPAAGETECRQGGPSRVEILFADPVTAEDGNLGLGDEVTVSSNPAGSIGVSGLSIVGNKLAFNLSGVPDRSCLTVQLHGIAANPGGVSPPGAVMADTTLRQRIVYGDATGNGRVTSADVNMIKAGGSVSALTLRSDLNAGGTITTADASAAKGATNSSPATCP